MYWEVDLRVGCSVCLYAADELSDFKVGNSVSIRGEQTTNLSLEASQDRKTYSY
jgi:hypothetical protein